MDNDMDKKEDPYEFEKNLNLKNTCHTFFKPGASRQD